MQVEDILARLIAFPSVVRRPNGEIVEWIRAHAEACGAEVTVLPGPEGDRFNLFATIGPRDVPGYVLSGHMDVVPAGEKGWSADPFTLTAVGSRLYGRGTSDMKGFLACALAALPRLATRRLARPIHLAFSYDEEAGCLGVPHMLARLPELCARPLGCVVGEATALRAIRAHKGKAAVRLTVRGRPGHSSRPDLALNAVHGASRLLARAVETAEALTRGPLDGAFEPPWSTLQVGVIDGGKAVNIVPGECRLEIEARAIAGVVPGALLEPIRAVVTELEAKGFGVDWEVLSDYPALGLAADAPLVRLFEELTGSPVIDAVSYGTEAGLFQAAGIDAIICGPGDISRTHKPDEFVERGELVACVAMIEALADRVAV